MHVGTCCRNTLPFYWTSNPVTVPSKAERPLLTPAGEEQTVKAANFFLEKFLEGLPAPQSYYSSPLSRCTTTANLTFASLDLPRERPFRPVIKEYLREGVSIHTCDRRSNRTYISSIFEPENPLTFEEGFAEFDGLWDGVLVESRSSQEWRSKVVLDDIFTADGNTWLSIASHSGEVRTLLSVLGHRTFRLSTGQIIPVLVRATYVDEEEPATATEP
ncbi:hypothetical protein MKZ38_003747 [Zalerion maritima]|uniref:Phosphoglycerate mutase n=1 Tax=Zalerion maritima TaxID=339359 RepID=A0AAD5RTX1_9PEZI|nr:hypothetical protein MKZ38_003747 [Zalerion maritima]